MIYDLIFGFLVLACILVIGIAYELDFRERCEREDRDWSECVHGKH